MFFGTARTSGWKKESALRLAMSVMVLTPFRHLDKKELLAFLRLCDMCRDEGILQWTNVSERDR